MACKTWVLHSDSKVSMSLKLLGYTHVLKMNHSFQVYLYFAVSYSMTV